MSAVLPVEQSKAANGWAVAREQWAIWSELTKIRLSSMVLITAGVGYFLGAGSHFRWPQFLIALAGTALAAFAASAANQALEIENDALMERTRNRPLPSGRLSKPAAVAASAGMIVAGSAILALGANWLTAALGVACFALYVWVYTPLKKRSSLNTVVGAVCGAIPPMMGWSAATGSLSAGAWVLGAILFVWQIPHFLAIAWMHRDDYARGGFRMLPMIDPEGAMTGRMATMYTLTLAPVGLAAWGMGLAGGLFAMGSVALMLAFLSQALLFQFDKSRARARGLFLVSLLYLPLLLGLMIADRTPASAHAAAARRGAGLVELKGAE